jgi:hypothetical protein
LEKIASLVCNMQRMTITIGEMFAKKKDFENQNIPPLLMYPKLPKPSLVYDGLNFTSKCYKFSLL